MVLFAVVAVVVLAAGAELVVVIELGLGVFGVAGVGVVAQVEVGVVRLFGVAAGLECELVAGVGYCSSLLLKLATRPRMGLIDDLCWLPRPLAPGPRSRSGCCGAS